MTKNIIFLIWLWVAFGCSSSREVIKTQIKVDSTRIVELSDSLRLLLVENASLTASVNELMYGGISFDSAFIRDTITNTVIIRPDGTVEATGKIRELKWSMTRQKQIIQHLTRLVDSLRAVKEKVKTETKYISETKDKKTKTVLFPWYLLVIAAAAALTFYLIKNSKA